MSDGHPPPPRRPSSSSTSSDELSRLAASVPSREAVDAVKEFRFHSPALYGALSLRQPDVGGSIGFKLYPAALFCCKLLECMWAAGRGEGADALRLWAAIGGASHGPPPLAALAILAALPIAGSVFLELGAGICGLPSQLLARMGARAFATDLPTVLPQLQENITANASVVSAAAPSLPISAVTTLPLCWGDVSSAGAVIAALGGKCDVIIAADVVYHEELIEPLLQTLLELTHPDTGLTSTSHAGPPPVLISYVQRFKRAKEFLKKARRAFDVDVLSVSPVVDYDALNWNRGGSVVDVHSASADVTVFAPGAAEPPVSCLAYHYLLRRKALKK